MVPPVTVPAPGPGWMPAGPCPAPSAEPADAAMQRRGSGSKGCTLAACARASGSAGATSNAPGVGAAWLHAATPTVTGGVPTQQRPPPTLGPARSAAQGAATERLGSVHVHDSAADQPVPACRQLHKKSPLHLACGSGSRA